VRRFIAAFFRATPLFRTIRRADHHSTEGTFLMFLYVPHPLYSLIVRATNVSIGTKAPIPLISLRDENGDCLHKILWCGSAGTTIPCGACHRFRACTEFCVNGVIVAISLGKGDSPIFADTKIGTVPGFIHWAAPHIFDPEGQNGDDFTIIGGCDKTIKTAICHSQTVLIGYNGRFGPSWRRVSQPAWRVFTMAKSKKKAEVVFLVCKETGDYNYTLRRKPGGEKLSVKKYCPKLRKHTEHAEKKK
jgi:large subunit ribosomal protein L33